MRDAIRRSDVLLVAFFALLATLVALANFIYVGDSPFPDVSLNGAAAPFAGQDSRTSSSAAETAESTAHRARPGNPSLRVGDPDAAAQDRPGLSDRDSIDPRSKLSPDLIALMDSGEPGPYRVIVQTEPNSSRPGSALDSVRDWTSRRNLTSESDFEFMGATVLRLEDDQLLDLASRGAIKRITLDRKVQGDLAVAAASTGVDQIRALPHGQTLDGDGITIAIIDSGIDTKHPDFGNYDGTGGGAPRVKSVDFVSGRNKGKDKYGHGTHVAAIAAGAGLASSDEPEPCIGIAPKANLLNLRVLGDEGVGYVSSVLQAIDYAIRQRDRQNIRVLNLSLGHPVYEPYGEDPLCIATGLAVEAGIAVVVAAGNSGSSDGQVLYGGIHSPGNAPWVITVGATKTQGTPARSDDAIASYSSRGPTLFDGLIKPDLVAPGDRIISSQAKDCFLAQEYPQVLYELSDGSSNRYMRLSGTSMATPVVSGALALLFEANQSLTPNAAKAILLYTAEKMIHPDIFSQGNGSLNILGAVALAKAISGDSKSIHVKHFWLDADSRENAKGIVQPYNRIADEVIWWGAAIAYGNGILWTHDNIAWTGQDVWGQGILWTHGVIWTSGGAWIDDLMAFKQMIYGEGFSGPTTMVIQVTSGPMASSGRTRIWKGWASSGPTPSSGATPICSVSGTRV